MGGVMMASFTIYIILSLFEMNTESFIDTFPRPPGYFHLFQYVIPNHPKIPQQSDNKAVEDAVFGGFFAVSSQKNALRDTAHEYNLKRYLGT